MGQDIGPGWPDCGEVDVLEDFGYATVQSSVHAPAGGDAVHSAHRDLPSDSGWHVYRLDWSASSLSFSRDGGTLPDRGPGFLSRVRLGVWPPGTA